MLLAVAETDSERDTRRLAEARETRERTATQTAASASATPDLSGIKFVTQTRGRVMGYTGHIPGNSDNFRASSEHCRLRASPPPLPPVTHSTSLTELCLGNCCVCCSFATTAGPNITRAPLFGMPNNIERQRRRRIAASVTNERIRSAGRCL